MTIRDEALILASTLSNAEDGLVLPGVCAELIRLARRYAKIQERWCNEDMSGTPGLEDRVRAREKKLEEKIRAVASEIKGVKGVKFTGDPRGYCVRLHLRSGKYNTWGGVDDGYGIA
jgi:hypothetical protein